MLPSNNKRISSPHTLKNAPDFLKEVWQHGGLVVGIGALQQVGLWSIFSPGPEKSLHVLDIFVWAVWVRWTGG